MIQLLTILQGDARARLKQLADNSVHCIVTSIPYWGLRSYGTEPQVWPDGQPLCEGEHEWAEKHIAAKATNYNEGFNSRWEGSPNPIQKQSEQGKIPARVEGTCMNCNAWRGELGLEPTPELFIKHIVETFQDVRRVLRNDGVLWLNIGDSYNSKPATSGVSFRRDRAEVTPVYRDTSSLKPKDLLMIPARVAIALQSDGWFLRQEIVWSKPNAMPESVTDRCTRSHEMVYMLTKRATYFYDSEAIKEPSADPLRTDYTPGKRAYAEGNTEQCNDTRTRRNDGFEAYKNGKVCVGRNKRSVWTIPTQPTPDAHFAVFPESLVKPCILAGTSEKGCCTACGAPYKRIVGPTPEYAKFLGRDWSDESQDNEEGRGHFVMADGSKNAQRPVKRNAPSITAEYVTTGWQATCGCFYGPGYADTEPCVVLDPFAGSGTVGKVALELGRRAILIELNPKYVQLINKRCAVTYGLPLVVGEAQPA